MAMFLTFYTGTRAPCAMRPARNIINMPANQGIADGAARKGTCEVIQFDRFHIPLGARRFWAPV
ncbi:hypothetical protein [Alicyclobacillus fodiniaquatilis]|uniref:Uncharacterized protein n=1 Tax=Alicyclobacillus fodiniaquatilis TaxID=1661150 RepID=A0ABW4JD03_9BACL